VAIFGNKGINKEGKQEKVILDIRKAVEAVEARKSSKESKENKEGKQNKAMQEFMEKYKFEDLDDKDIDIVKKIAGELLKKDVFEGSVALARGRSEELANVFLINAQIEQNWIIIRQLSRLNNNIEKLLEK
jgi:hypothetical protein